MIRSWIALLAMFLGVPAFLLAEELPTPKVNAAQVPPPPMPQMPFDLPVPDIAGPKLAAPEVKPADPAPTVVAPKVVAPSSLFPSFDPAPTPGPLPSIVQPSNPNPSGTTPNLPTEGSVAPQNTPNNNVPNELKWRYKWHQGQWWYWSPDERWMIWDKNSWILYDAATYKAPAGFARPGPRVVTQSSSSVPLPESYSTTEISVPQSYYLTPSPTYVQPTPYAFGASSYYGQYGPAASYYNGRRGVSISVGAPAYYPSAIPAYVPAYGYPGYYGGRGVSIGFGF